MILQALADYYDRSGELAPPGWQYMRIPFVIEITETGRFVQLTSLRHGPKASDVAPSRVPQSAGRSGTKAYEKPNLLWDHIGFVLGHPKSDAAADVAMAAKQHQHFRRRLNEFAARLPQSRGLTAVQRFYENDEPQRVKADPAWTEASAIAGCNVTFRLASDTDLVVHEPAIRALIAQDAGLVQEGPRAICLVSGDEVVIERLHTSITGVGEKPAPLSAINDGALPAFASHGKSQGENFPVGQAAVFKYTTALNHLLRPGSPQKLRLADAVAVFWSQGQDAEFADDWLAQIFGDDDPDAHTRQVRSLYEAVQSGAFAQPRGDNKFYVLGLAPNAARIAVRFWHDAPLRVLAQRVVDWFEDLALAGAPYDPIYPTLKALLRAVVLQRKDDNIPPGLGGDVLRAIFTGSAFPTVWLNLAVQRSRAEQSVPHLRACVIKACLNRSIRLTHSSEEAYTTMLDTQNTQPAYRLGRLFAVLEKIQEESAGGSLNKTIRDRYYGAASSTPASVVPLLLKLKNHHVSKLDDRGQRMLYRAFQDHRPDDYIGQVLSDVVDIPAHLSLPEQGRFALGYYHQRQAFFTKANATADTTVHTEPTA